MCVIWCGCYCTTFCHTPTHTHTHIMYIGEVSKSTMFASCTSELSENFKKTQVSCPFILLHSVPVIGSSVITLCVYAQQGYAFDCVAIGLCM